MTDMKSIRFPAPAADDMVRATLDGRKTVTRLVVNPQPTHNSTVFVHKANDGTWFWWGGGSKITKMKPHYQPGNILYAQETWTKLWYVDQSGYTHYDQPMYYYAADGTPDITLYDEDGFELDDQRIRWHPSINMPREAARIFLRVTDMRVERLQEITELDILEKEGVTVDFPQPKPSYISLAYTETRLKPAVRKAFADLWDSTINPTGHDIFGWDANPYVWRVSFERISKEEAFTNV